MANPNTYSKGDSVEWDWGSGTATATVSKKYTTKTTKTLDGSEVTRNGSESDPAYLLEQEDGSEVLKLGSELKKS